MSFTFATKAVTLERLAPLVKQARVLPLLYFSVAEWRSEPELWLERIVTQFCDEALAVRSSSLAEDGLDESLAGAFTSCLDVPRADSSRVRQAVEQVIASYRGNPGDHILVQPMLAEIAVSGVMTTHVIDDGAPYYVVNYDDDSGKTDTVTGGTGVSKTVLVSRQARDSMLESPRLRRWLALARELEALCGEVPLDIEFAQTHNEELYLFQVRPIAVAAHWNRAVGERVVEAEERIADYFQKRSRRRPGLLGRGTVLGEMPDWNPAEIIGTNPRPLATSLYRNLVTDSVWREARGLMGYRQPLHECLLVTLGGRPYIDVRNSFNSLLPADLSDEVGEKIVNAWLERLCAHPELHDKVEFEIATTALDFSFEDTWRERYPGLLSPAELVHFRDCLQRLTQRALRGDQPGSLNWALTQSAALRLPQPLDEDWPDRLQRLLDECRDGGTRPFAVAARHAFIAEALLRSAVQRGALSSARLQVLKASLRTVAGRMAADLADVARGALGKNHFLQRYGHLRPGTYDIRSLRYDQRDELFSEVQLPEQLHDRREFQLTQDERSSLQRLLDEANFTISSQEWLDHCGRAIVAREEIKFEFSRHLSEVLECIVAWGQEFQLDRDQLSYLEVQSILDLRLGPLTHRPQEELLRRVEQARLAVETARALRISYLVRDPRDLFVAPMHRSAPNFITDQRIEARVVRLEGHCVHTPDLHGAIVCTENADPGFDWIFTRGIAGLITQFGGSNSHMAVRSAELSLPAAIGCGEVTFQRLLKATRVELNCAERIVRPIYG